MFSKERQKTSSQASYTQQARKPFRSHDHYSRLSSACVQEDSSESNPSKQGQLSPSVSLSKHDVTGNLNSLLHVVSELKQIDLTTTLENYKELKDDLQNKTKQLQQAEKKLEVTQSESNRLRAQLQQAEKEREKYKSDLKLKTEELEAKTTLLTRQQTVDAEPQPTGIKSDTPPDFSDPMGPLMMAEKYNELYDNELTDAMEILGEIEKNEQLNVQVLLETLKKCYTFCADLAEKQMESLEMVLVHPNDIRPKPALEKLKKLNIPKSMHKQLKDCRKEMSTTTIDSIKLEQLTDKLGSLANKIPNFVSKCIEICWFMCVLDPPVVLGDEASLGTTFDTNIYRPYTNSGTVVSYNVWPPLLLHQNGNILVKGIVEPVKAMKKKTTARMDVNGMKETKSTKDRPNHAITYSIDRLTETVEYGDAGYDPMVDANGRHEPLTDAYGRHEPVTDAYDRHEPETDVYGRQYHVTKPIKTYDQSTRNG
ncbi:structural maintenance of chromosomes protein 2-like [Argopecten irradians]|uniref:structural maintenance of chromosomes protein 2-like n=1 Tax=Argopecten irradians TaxID=31199 RepID=UPI003722E31E